MFAGANCGLSPIFAGFNAQKNLPLWKVRTKGNKQKPDEPFLPAYTQAAVCCKWWGTCRPFLCCLFSSALWRRWLEQTKHFPGLACLCIAASSRLMAPCASIAHTHPCLQSVKEDRNLLSDDHSPSTSKQRGKMKKIFPVFFSFSQKKRKKFFEKNKHLSATSGSKVLWMIHFGFFFVMNSRTEGVAVSVRQSIQRPECMGCTHTSHIRWNDYTCLTAKHKAFKTFLGPTPFFFGQVPLSLFDLCKHSIDSNIRHTLPWFCRFECIKSSLVVFLVPEQKTISRFFFLPQYQDNGRIHA